MALHCNYRSFPGYRWSPDSGRCSKWFPLTKVSASLVQLAQPLGTRRLDFWSTVSPSVILRKLVFETQASKHRCSVQPAPRCEHLGRTSLPAQPSRCCCLTSIFFAHPGLVPSHHLFPSSLYYLLSQQTTAVDYLT